VVELPLRGFAARNVQRSKTNGDYEEVENGQGAVPLKSGSDELELGEQSRVSITARRSLTVSDNFRVRPSDQLGMPMYHWLPSLPTPRTLTADERTASESSTWAQDDKDFDKPLINNRNLTVALTLKQISLIRTIVAIDLRIQISRRTVAYLNLDTLPVDQPIRFDLTWSLIMFLVNKNKSIHEIKISPKDLIVMNEKGN
jgi:hypothetical protein